MTKTEYVDLLNTLNPCSNAIEWTIDDGGDTLQDCWNNCPRGDRMLLLLGKLKVDRKKLVLSACKIARLALPYVVKGELRPLCAIELTERWAKNDKTVRLEDVKIAATAAFDSTVAAYSESSAAASSAATYAASAASATRAATASSAAALSSAAAFAAAAFDTRAARAATRAAFVAAAASVAAKKKILQQCADIVRADWPDINKLLRTEK